MKRKVLLIILVVVVLGGGFFLIKKKNAVETTVADALMVKLAEAELGEITTTVSADGTVKAYEENEIKVELKGLVEEIYFENGDYVNKGDKMFKIDDRIVKNSLETANLNLEEAQRSYQNLLDTYNSQDDLNKLKLVEAERNLEIALLNLENEKLSLERQQQEAEDKLQEAVDALQKAEDKVKKNEYLYDNNALPLAKLEEAEDLYKQAKIDLTKAQEKLDILVEKTIPNSLNLAQLNLDNSRSHLSILKATIEKDKITENDLKLASIKVDKVKKEIEKLNDDLNKIIVYAPVSGTIISLDVKKGALVEEGTTLVKVADLNDLIIEVMVDELNINEVREKQNVKITGEAFDKVIEGRVIWISPVGTKVGNINKYLTKIELEEVESVLKLGMFVNAEIVTNHRDSIVTLPTLAILGDKEKYVFVAADGEAEKRPIQIGLQTLSSVEVRGVQEGEQVIIGPFTVLKQLQPGTAIANVDEG